MGLGVGALLGGIASGGLGLLGSSNQNSAMAALQGQQEAYNTQMADTQYQRGVTDMEAAGLNPLMMFQSGGGPAPSPTAPGYTPQNTLNAASNSAGQITQNIAQDKLLETQQHNADVDTSTKIAQSNSADSQAQIDRLKAAQEQINYNSAQATYQGKIDATNAQNQYLQKANQLNYKWATPDKIIHSTGNALGGAASAATLIP